MGREDKGEAEQGKPERDKKKRWRGSGRPETNTFRSLEAPSRYEGCQAVPSAHVTHSASCEPLLTHTFPNKKTKKHVLLHITVGAKIHHRNNVR